MSQPSHFGRYAVIKKVGSGGFATVWLARDEELDAEVAIKVLAEHWVDDHDVRRRFVEEGRFLRKVDSPYVVGVHDIGSTADDRPFLVLTYADRGTLADRIKDGPLGLTETVDVIEHVGAGLQELHDRGVLHRDVKPANVLFRSTPTGERAMLGDLGLGKSLDAVSRVTMPGGTPAYVAPEQVRGDTLDPRADLYALAAVTYAALAGKPPYGATTLAAVLVVEGPPDSLRTVREDLPAEVDEVVLRALRHDRDERWPDVRSFAEALKQAALAPVAVAADPPAARGGAVTAAPVHADRPIEAEPVPVAQPAPAAAQKSSARPWVAAAVAAALLGGAGGYAGWRYGETRQWVRAADTTGAVSLELPRGWTGSNSASGWQPPGATGRLPGLLVSQNNADWGRTGKTVSGVFAGVLPTAQLPTTLPVPAGCGASSERSTTPTSITVKYPDCPPGMTTYERVVRLEGRAVRIEVRAEDEDQAIRVLDSVRYDPGT
jgi:hypothetical protein